MYGKLIDGNVVFAARDQIYDNVKYKPAPAWVLEALGYKEVIYTDAPECPEGKKLESGWTEKEKTIEQTWTIVDYNPTPAEQCANLRYWFDNYYRQYNEKLTRFAALGIEEPIEDPIRKKTYNTLMDLYTEAEIVRDEIHQLENEEE